MVSRLWCQKAWQNLAFAKVLGIFIFEKFYPQSYIMLMSD